ncbi:conserved hypothetical protein [Denitrovibrio acetiphilus DSM 12809]|uniref:YtxH domain-containing protein n=1 Tax=Denitrovibrio acetiphilus (strain DSM 12809 / NBRC 114555 / N2460) TaxID=522772 RepID=D4H2A4_DENA2|nr:hypothetical protein [Denitrovibrio acetiphilus]ADD68895.1 conserved hypothetical protein [Denitrovibrio acetiphilus DSM 12809]
MDHKKESHENPQYQAQPQQTYYQNTPSHPQQAYYQPNPAYHLKEWFNFREPSYVKGLAVGAGLALVLTNPAVKKALVKGVVKVWGGLQGGVEELKEQIRDVQAEMGGE